MIIKQMFAYNCNTRRHEYVDLDTDDIHIIETISDSLYSIELEPAFEGDGSGEYTVSWATGTFIKEAMMRGDISSE